VYIVGGGCIGLVVAAGAGYRGARDTVV
jgi:hypothetical protein